MKAILLVCLLVAMFHLTVHSLTTTDQHNDQFKAAVLQEYPHEGDSLGSCLWIVSSDMDFALQFYKQVTKQEHGKNIFLYPDSVTTALALMALYFQATS